jgi:hypothetical protein
VLLLPISSSSFWGRIYRMYRFYLG